MVLENGTDFLQIQRIRVGHERHRVRIAHRNTGNPVFRPADGKRRTYHGFRFRDDRNLCRPKHGIAHIHRHKARLSLRDGQRKMLDSAERFDVELRFVREPVVIEILPDAADGIAAHLSLAAVEIEHPHFCIRRLRAADEDKTISAESLPGSNGMPSRQFT